MIVWWWQWRHANTKRMVEVIKGISNSEMKPMKSSEKRKKLNSLNCHNKNMFYHSMILSKLLDAVYKNLLISSSKHTSPHSSHSSPSNVCLYENGEHSNWAYLWRFRSRAWAVGITTLFFVLLKTSCLNLTLNFYNKIINRWTPIQF